MKVNEVLSQLESMPAEADVYFWITSNGKRCLCTPKEFFLAPDGDKVGMNTQIIIAMNDEVEK